MMESNLSARIPVSPAATKFFRATPNMTQGVINSHPSWKACKDFDEEARDEKLGRQGRGRRGRDAGRGARNSLHARRGGRDCLLHGPKHTRASEHDGLLRGTARN